MDSSFHYPPELLSILVDTLPKLSRSKADLLLFFRGAGVPETVINSYRARLGTEPALSKYHIARELLTKLNEQGDKALSARRELVKRVVEFEDYSLCWENDRAAARGLVAQIRDLVNVKDSFTRIRLAKEEELRQKLHERDAASRAGGQRRNERERGKSDLFRLFAENDAHKRGKALEGVLNRLFASYEVLVREAFTLQGTGAEGVIEQIDGAVEFDGHLYLAEMKWMTAPIGPAEISPHLVRVFSRGGQVRGLFISYSTFTPAAIGICRDAIAQGRVVVLSTLEEIVNLLSRDGDLKPWLKAKVEAALIDKQPFASRP